MTDYVMAASEADAPQWWWWLALAPTVAVNDAT